MPTAAREPLEIYTTGADNDCEETSGEEAAILLASLRSQLDRVSKHRDQMQQRAARLEEVVAVNKELAEANRELAETASTAYDTVQGELDRNRVTLVELELLARTRASLRPEDVVESFPDDLLRALASLDPDRSRLAEHVISRLRPGSVALLEVYGVCSLGEPNGQEVRPVTLNARTWKFAELARQLCRARSTGDPSDEELDRRIEDLGIIIAEHFQSDGNVGTYATTQRTNDDLSNHGAESAATAT